MPARFKRQLPFLGIFVLYSFVILLFCSRTSPLFVLDDYVDANVYFTMGKGWVHGKVPYLDLFDHKGPLLYLLYALAYLVNRTGFLGVFLIQVAFMAATQYFCYKIAALYGLRWKAALLVAFLVPAPILASGIFATAREFGGGSPEELAIPFMAAGLWLVLRYYKNFAGYQKPAGHMFFTLGAATGCVLMLKLNLVAMFAGLVLPLFFDMLRRGKIKIFFLNLMWFALGGAAIVAPYLVYAVATGSLSAFLEAYYSFNVSYAGMLTKGFWDTVFSAVNQAAGQLFSDWPRGMVTVLGFVYVLFGDRRFALFARAGVALSGLLLYGAIGTSPLAYYRIPAMLYCLFGIIGVACLIKHLAKGRLPLAGKADRAEGTVLPLAAVGLVLFYTIGGNGLMTAPLLRFNAEAEAVPFQKTVLAMMENDAPENRTVLEVLNVGCGIYTLGDFVPESRFFYIPNIPHENYATARNSQLEDIRAGKYKYVLTLGGMAPHPWMDDPAIEWQLRNAVIERYDLIEILEGTGFFEGSGVHVYRLRDFVPGEVGQSAVLAAANPLLKPRAATREGAGIKAAGTEGVLFDGAGTTIESGRYDISFQFAEAASGATAQVLKAGEVAAQQAATGEAADIVLRDVEFSNDTGVEFRCLVEDGAEVVFEHITLTRTA